jgi:hypothetical protein
MRWSQLTRPPPWAPMQPPWLPALCRLRAHLLVSRQRMQGLPACGMLPPEAARGLLLPTLWSAQGQSRQPVARPCRAFPVLP